MWSRPNCFSITMSASTGPALGQHGRALHVAADHLVRPPLVRHLVRGDVERRSRRRLARYGGDEADVLPERHGAREGLRELGVAGNSTTRSCLNW